MNATRNALVPGGVHFIRTKNNAASAVMPRFGTHAAVIGSTSCFAASDDATLAKR